jgi:hypothetical protein
MYGCQCAKRLYLHKYNPELKDARDIKQQAVFDRGTNIGLLAQQRFAGGVDAAPPDAYSYDLAVAKTKAFIDQGATIIYEASFMYEGVLCAVDILEKKDNTWHAYEVKSTTKVKTQHITDAALQYWVLTQCGLPLEDISIVTLNNQYVRMGAIDVMQLFMLHSVLPEVLEEQPFIQEKVTELKSMLARQQEPVVDIGPQCNSPYPCDFITHCFSHMPVVNSVLELPGRTAWKLYNSGIKHLDEIPDTFELTDKVAHQLNHYRSGEVHINREAIKEFLAPLTYPLYFFDFETIMPGVPEFDNSKPYQQIPFQYSLHVLRAPDTERIHYAYLGDGINDPRKDLITSMLQHLGTVGSIICYNMSFEKGRIKELIHIFPDYENELLAINARVVDLMIPFAKRWYYHPLFLGRYSIKTVLPVLVPDLRYDELIIQEGGTASLVYAQLKLQDEFTAATQREQLLAYCELDTLGMVRIMQHLELV